MSGCFVAGIFYSIDVKQVLSGFLWVMFKDNFLEVLLFECCA